MTLFMLFLSGDWVLRGSEPCFSLWFLNWTSQAGKVINHTGFLFSCSFSQPHPTCVFLWGGCVTSMGRLTMGLELFLPSSSFSAFPARWTHHLPTTQKLKPSTVPRGSGEGCSFTHFFLDNICKLSLFSPRSKRLPMHLPVSCPASQTCSAGKGLVLENIFWVAAFLKILKPNRQPSSVPWP